MRATAIVALAALAVPASVGGASKAPPAVDWTRTVARTPAGGFRMGNPQAKVKLVEYGSMTCPHCRAFDAAGSAKLIDGYVKTGKVSFEFRNYVRDPFDLAASLVSRCNGARSFFPLTRALFRDQPKWVQKIQTAPKPRLEQLASLEPNRLALQAARIAGFQQWAAGRGVPMAKSSACLTNAKEVNLLVQMNGKATELYPDFPGTPAFVLNGKMIGTRTWDALEPELRTALGERG